MNYGSVLPVTGGAGMMVMGWTFGLDDIIAAAIALVLLGIFAYRHGTRVGRYRTTFFIGLAAGATIVALVSHRGGMAWGYAITNAAVFAMIALYLTGVAARRGQARSRVAR